VLMGLRAQEGDSAEIPDTSIAGVTFNVPPAVTTNSARVALGLVPIQRGANDGVNALSTAPRAGKEFADNSLIVGAPARVVRTLDDKAREAIARGADIYVRRWQQYARGLKRVG
jgi:carbonic anhydrase/acetyltransferase-like protein (isoleucine patch superfamily)